MFGMKKLSILRFPDSRLRKKGELVKEVTPEMAQLGRDMLELMYESKGVGLAAIQVDKPFRLLVADTRIQNNFSDNDREQRPVNMLKTDLETQVAQPLILFNPEVTYKEGEVVFPEGCLSFPSYYAEVKRAEVVVVKALNEKGEEIQIKTDGLLSICLQHEIDHLDGKLFIDHLSSLKSDQLRGEIKKYGYPELERSK